MKITRRQLKRIINEEMDRHTVKEDLFDKALRAGGHDLNEDMFDDALAAGELNELDDAFDTASQQGDLKLDAPALESINKVYDEFRASLDKFNEDMTVIDDRHLDQIRQTHDWFTNFVFPQMAEGKKQIEVGGYKVNPVSLAFFIRPQPLPSSAAAAFSLTVEKIAKLSGVPLERVQRWADDFNTDVFIVTERDVHATAYVNIKSSLDVIPLGKPGFVIGGSIAMPTLRDGKVEVLEKEIISAGDATLRVVWNKLKKTIADFDLGLPV